MLHFKRIQRLCFALFPVNLQPISFHEIYVHHMKNIILVRHTTVDIQPGVHYGQTDVPLCSNFPLEAAVVKACLSNYGRFDLSFSSPLTRCTRLAEYCGYPDAILDDRLMERNLGDWEMQASETIADPLYDAWRDNPYRVAATRGESFSDMIDRVSDFMDDLSEMDFSQCVIFTHGGVIACAMVWKGLCTWEEALHIKTTYGCLIQLGRPVPKAKMADAKTIALPSVDR